MAWLLGENRRAVPWRTIGLGLGLTILLAVLLLKVPPIRAGFAVANDAVDAVAAATRAGTSFVFGYLGGGPLPFEPKTPGSEFVLAFQALPIALVMSVLTTLLFHWRILPPVVRGFSRLLERTLGIGGAVGLSTAANIFVGMVEAPLFIRPYLAQLSRSELFIVMTGGMAGIAGTVFAVYATLLRSVIPDVAGHLLVASVLGAPAAVVISLIMVPERPEAPKTGALPDAEPVAASTMDAIVKGAAVGLELLLNIVMTGGMAGIAGTVFAVYATLLRSVIPDVAGHLLVASVLGAPAAVVISLIMVPERPEAPKTGALPDAEPVAASTMDAIVKGAAVGLELLLNIVAMLIVLVALVHLANAVLGLLPEIGGPITLQRLLGTAMAPVCWLLGIPWAEAATAGALMGVKTVLNEFIAYLEMAKLPPEALSPRSKLIMLYALCGFANFGSLGIMIGGLATVAPSRRGEIVSLGPRTIVSGTLSTCLIGAVVGMLS